MDENKESVLLEIPSNELTEIVSITEICRLCANQQDKLIGIYTEDGENNDLASKMNSYLPIKVDKTDDLPLQCCWQCASTVLAWHELFITSIEADRRLRSYQFLTDVTEKQLSIEESVKTDLQQIEQEKDDSDLQILSENSSVLVERAVMTDYTDNISEYIALQQDYLPLQAIYDSNKEDLEESEDLSTDKIEMFNEDDPPPKKELDEVCYGCQMCQMLFLSEEEMQKHITQNHPYQKEAESDSKANIKKERKKNAKIDQEKVNAAKLVVDGKVYYNCKECGRCLYSPYTYIWHVRIHTGERPHSCHLCGKCFRVSQGLVRHLKETHEGIKNFPCDICGRMFATRRNADEHRRIHTNERPYICDLCGKSFKQKASLYVHNRSHQDVFPFKCSYCHQTFRTRPPMLVHITKHTGEKPYPCEVCGRRFRIKYELKRHRLIHSDEKPFACELCGLRFKQKSPTDNITKNGFCDKTENSSTDEEIIEDIKNADPNRARIEYLQAVDLSSNSCKLCILSFSTKTVLKNHMLQLHNLKQPQFRRKKIELNSIFNCSMCNKSFTRKFDMHRHTLKKHPEISIESSSRSKNLEIINKCKVIESGLVYYECDICHTKFKSCSPFIPHYNIHMNRKLHCCHLCGKEFKRSAHLKRHVDSLHYGIKKYDCEYCDQTFTSKTTKDEHLNTHTKTRPFMCDVCGKSFKQSSSLYIHKMFHKDVFPFSCNVCDKKFRRKCELKKHTYIHTGERQFSCEICKRPFKLRQDLKRHMKIHK